MEERKCPFCLTKMEIKDEEYECLECEVKFTEEEISHIA